MRIRFLLILLTITLLILGCNANSEETDNPQLKAELEKHADNYMSGLKTVLLQNMKQGGPLQAVNVCSDTASLMTDSFSDKAGVEVKRFSFKNRNSQNYPREFEKEILEQFEKLFENDNLSAGSYQLRNIRINGKEAVTFAKPIFVAAPCLNCHGSEEQISEEVKTVISENYPEDKAIGYKIGDLRGAISVTKIL